MKLLPLLLATATMSLSAQDANLGLRAHGLLPMGDLRSLTDGKIGAGIAAFVAIPLDNGIVLRPQVGYQQIPKGSGLGVSDAKTSVASVDLMMGGLWFPGGDPDQGPYLIGALGVQQWRLTDIGTPPATLSVTRLGASGGLGYQFSHRLGFEASGFWSPVNNTITASGLMLAATLRF